MKIIDNKKDYYDYLSGVYGIDPYVVYDRRGSVGSDTIIEEHPLMFDKREQEEDKHPYARYGRYAKNVPFLERVFDITVEAGEKHFYIKCKRYRETETSPVKLTFERFDPTEQLKRDYHLDLYGKSSFFMDRYNRELERYTKKQSKAPLAIFYTDYSNYWSGGRGMIENPILKGLPITGLIPPDEIWQGIYDYLLKMKEPVIVDSRTNDEHIESAGFDKKTSFRNVK